ncbi:2,3-diphosphoglycerate-dependent phosphoglycerate mutase [Candidatus Woesearchaeota archaeon]|nr:MAG: 2,3-diphosphoglycerate-dependent phosphoglycerate mutase [Candidatus Woesearchaeota archaeon]
MNVLVLLRHGESTWNKENRFTGWTDVPLTKKGEEEARHAGRILKENGFTFDVVFTSFLKRAIQTAQIVLDEMNLSPLIVKTWRLNEKHYGALQGLNKKETAEKEGEEQVFKWRRVYDCRPPALDKDDPRHPIHDKLYEHVDPALLPSTESLEDCVKRTIPFWETHIAPAIISGQRVLIVAHGNSLRALIKHLEAISDKDIAQVNIPTGIPLVYELDENLNPTRKYYLADEEEVKKRQEEMVKQGKA